MKPGGYLIIGDTPWYSCDECGHEMVQERRRNFMERFGTASASLESFEFLTDERLQSLEELLRNPLDRLLAELRPSLGHAPLSCPSAEQA